MQGLRIEGLSPAVADEVRRSTELTPTIVRERHSAPCRVCLRDAEPGEEVLLFGHSPFDRPHPYRTVGPIFVHAAPCVPFDGVAATEVPDALRRRLLSVRAHDRDGRMLDADVAPGDELLAVAARMLAHPGAHEIHVHHARPGCFACKIVSP